MNSEVTNIDQVPSSISDTRITNGNIQFSIKWVDSSSSTKLVEKQTKRKILKFQKNHIIKANPLIGSFTRQDKPFKIKEVRKLEKDIEFIVEWNVRENGVKPLDSVITNEDFKIYNKEFLINFYEDHFYFNQINQFSISFNS